MARSRVERRFNLCYRLTVFFDGNRRDYRVLLTMGEENRDLQSWEDIAMID